MTVLEQAALEFLWATLAVAGIVAALRRKAVAAMSLLATSILLCSNFSITPYLFGLKNPFPVYHYVSSDRGFAGDECFKSTACYWSVLQRDFSAYAQQHPGVALLRQEPLRPWAFWNWYDYATHPRWRLGYSEPGQAPTPPATQ